MPLKHSYTYIHIYDQNSIVYILFFALFIKQYIKDILHDYFLNIWHLEFALVHEWQLSLGQHFFPLETIDIIPLC